MAEGAWARAMPAGGNSAAYLELRNEGGRGDRLLGGETPAAEAVEIHESRMDDGIMRMRRVEGGLDLPPGEGVVLEPGGVHLMILELKEPLEPGDTIRLDLRFRDSAALTLSVPVRAPGGESGS